MGYMCEFRKVEKSAFRIRKRQPKESKWPALTFRSPRRSRVGNLGPPPPDLGGFSALDPREPCLPVSLVSLQFRPCFLFKQEVKSCSQALLLMEMFTSGWWACGEGRGVVAVIEEG